MLNSEDETFLTFREIIRGAYTEWELLGVTLSYGTAFSKLDYNERNKED